MKPVQSLAQFASKVRELINVSGGPASLSDSQFGELALELFAAQFAANPAYRTVALSRSTTPDTLTDWRLIPAVPTAGFKELEFTSIGSAGRERVFHSSGTTSQRPSRHVHHQDSLAIYADSAWQWFRRHFCQAPQTWDLRVLMPPPTAAPNSSLVYMCEVIRRRLNAGPSAFLGSADSSFAWHLEPDAVLKSLRAAAGGSQPVALLGTAFSFVQLLDQPAVSAKPLELPLGSCIMETGGYKGRSRILPKADLHRLISEGLGVAPDRIISEYGMSELSSQAYDTRLDEPQVDRVFHFPPWARIEIISPESGRPVAEGETGLIRVYDLANVYSVLAIQTEDLGVRRGAGFELAGRAEFAEPRGCSLMSQDLLSKP